MAELEKRVAAYVGARHAIATSSCTTALHLALILHEIGPGDEVIVPSFTFIATANAVLYTGATPVFADIDPHTYNISPECIEAAITSQTRAIMPVHQIGLAADMDHINDIALRHGLAVVEDAAPAIGATYKNKMVGGLGNLACFSFHPRKVITSGEGGMIMTDDETFAERARVLRAHGMSVSDFARHQAKNVVIEEYHAMGFNYRMSDLHAAEGIEQLKKLDYVIAKRKELAASYDKAFADLDCMVLPFSSAEMPNTYQSYIVRLREDAPKGREQVMQEMLEAGIATRRGVMAIHMEPFYRRCNPSVALPVTEEAVKNTLLLPIFTSMTRSEQEYVIDNLLRILRS